MDADQRQLYPLSTSHVEMGMAVVEGYTLPSLRLLQLAGCPLREPLTCGSRATLGLVPWRVMALALGPEAGG